LGQAVAEQMTKLGTFGKVTRAQLKDLGAEGKISTDVLIAALAQLGEKELPKLQKSFNTGQQAVADLGTATNKLQTAIGDAFGPIAIGLVKGFASVVNNAADAMERFNKFNLDRGNDAVAYEQAVRNANKKFFNNETAGGLINFLTPGYKEFVDKEYQRLQQQQQTQKKQVATADQLAARKQADAEREATRNAAATEDAKKRLGEQLKIREDAEKRLADFREQSIQRAAQFERDLGDQRQELERSTAEARRRIQAQQQDFALEAERQKLRGAGLGTEALDMQAFLNEGTRRFTEEKIQIEQSATDKRVQIERTLADYQLSVARGISDILQDAAQKMAQKMREGAQDAADTLKGQSPSNDVYNQPGVGYFSRSSGAFLGKTLPSAATGGTSMGGGIGSGFTQQQLNSATQAASKFAGVANMCSESVKAFYKSLGITLPGVTAWADTVRKAGTVMRDWSKLKPGDIVATGRPGDTPHVGVYTGENNVFHQSRSRGLRAGNFPDLDYFKQGGYFVRPSSGAPMAGAASAASAASAGVDMSGVTAAGRRLDAAIGANRAANIQAESGNQVANRNEAFSRATSEIEQQRRLVKEQREDYERMLELQRSGMSPELARQAVDRERAATSETSSLQVLEQQLVKDLQSKDLTVEQRANVEAILKSTQDRLAAQPGIVQGLTEEERKLQQLKQAYEQKKQLAQGIADSIGGGISQALDLVINGTENWGDSLRSIAAGVLKDIARQLLQIMVIQPIVKGIAAGIGNLFPSATGNVFAPGGVVPYAMGGIVTRPTIFPFADGGGFRTGLMGEAGPEAILPLKRGRGGKLGVAMQGEGGGSTNVTVNVDASGSQVQGDAGKGEQLGRVISQAVQAELIKQKRPGGLLTA
jgi:hypothetical protein